MRHARYVRAAVVRNVRTGEQVRLRDEYTVPALDAGQQGTLPDGDVLAEQHGIYVDLEYVDADGTTRHRRRAQNVVARLKPGQRVLVVADRLSWPGARGPCWRCWSGVVEGLDRYDALVPEPADELRILDRLLREAEALRDERKE